MASISGDLALHLPPTLDELVQAIETADATDEGLVPLSYRFADEVGALRHCAECERPIVEPEVLAETLAEHYRASDEERGALVDAIRASKLETGDDTYPDYCSYHPPLNSATS